MTGMRTKKLVRGREAGVKLAQAYEVLRILL